MAQYVLLKAAWAEMSSYKVRTFLGVLGVACGVTTLVVAIGVVRGTFSSWAAFVAENGGLGRITAVYRQSATAPQRFLSLTRSDAMLVKGNLGASFSTTMEGVLKSSFRCIESGIQDNYDLVGGEKTIEQIQKVHLIAGRFFSEYEVLNCRPVVVISEDTVAALKIPGAALGSVILINSMPCVVVGVYGRQERDRRLPFNPRYNTCYIPISVLLKMTGWGDSITAIEVDAGDTNKLEAAVSRFSNMLQFSRGGRQDFRLHARQEEFRAFSKTELAMNWGMFSVGSAILVIGGIGISNVMMASINERIREIGVRVALGATRRDLVLQFIIESVVVSLVGGLLGLGCGIILIPALDSVMPSDMPGHPIYVPEAFIIGIFVSGFVGVVAGIYPAQKACRLNPIDALRYE